MSGIQLNFNANQFNPSTGTADPLCDGWHLFVVKDSKIEDTQSGAGKKLVLEMDVVAGDFKGGKYWENYNIENASEKTVEIAYENLLALAEATCGLEQFRQTQNTASLFGIPFYGKIRTKNDYKNFAGWKPQSDQTIIVATRADAAAQKQASVANTQPNQQPQGGFQQPQGGFQPNQPVQNNAGFQPNQPQGGFQPSQQPQSNPAFQPNQQPANGGFAPQQNQAPNNQPQFVQNAQQGVGVNGSVPMNGGFQPSGMPQQPVQPQNNQPQGNFQQQPQGGFQPQGGMPQNPAWGQQQ